VVANPGEFRFMPRGIPRQVCIGCPKMRNATTSLLEVDTHGQTIEARPDSGDVDDARSHREYDHTCYSPQQDSVRRRQSRDANLNEAGALVADRYFYFCWVFTIHY